VRSASSPGSITARCSLEPISRCVENLFSGSDHAPSTVARGTGRPGAEASHEAWLSHPHARGRPPALASQNGTPLGNRRDWEWQVGQSQGNMPFKLPGTRLRRPASEPAPGGGSRASPPTRMLPALWHGCALSATVCVFEQISLMRRAIIPEPSARVCQACTAGSTGRGSHSGECWNTAGHCDRRCGEAHPLPFSGATTRTDAEALVACFWQRVAQELLTVFTSSLMLSHAKYVPSYTRSTRGPSPAISSHM